MTATQTQAYLALLRRELVPAMGCTEPIAIAYAAARARRLLGCTPTAMTVRCSGNVIKNTQSVTVPGTPGLHGIDISAILGALAGDADLGMEVLARVTPEDTDKAQRLRSAGFCQVTPLQSPASLHIIIELAGGGHTALVEIRDAHTNVVREERNGQVLFAAPEEEAGDVIPDCPMDMAEIYAFASHVPLGEIAPILRPQIQYNRAIAVEGLRGEWGAQVGKTLMNVATSLPARAAALAAAGSDARMGGCPMPVVINSGSGNQGITVSLPIICFAEEKRLPEEALLRALALGNLVALFQKSYIGKLSAYCGAVSAAAGSAAGIAFLNGDPLPVIEDTVVNTIANVSGMVCDGAKASCAAKIATAVEAGFLAHEMAVHGRVFHRGEGLVKENADRTIATYGHMARVGMRATDTEILHLMLEDAPAAPQTQHKGESGV